MSVSSISSCIRARRSFQLDVSSVLRSWVDGEMRGPFTFDSEDGWTSSRSLQAGRWRSTTM